MSAACRTRPRELAEITRRACLAAQISKPAVWPIPLNRPGVKRRLEVGLEICAAAGGAIYLQLEFVISRFLPPVNLVGKTKNH